MDVTTDTAQPDAPAADTADVESSLADHEQVFGDAAERQPAVAPVEPADTDAEGRERDETGKFKPRHRAKSQQASAEDVPRINELTRKLREAESRAEAAERRAAERRDDRREPERPAAEPAKAPTFPKFEQWLTANPDRDFEDYIDARYGYHRYLEREQEAAYARAKETHDLVTTFKADPFIAETPDFREVVSGENAETSKVVEHAVLRVGPKAAYYLATHPDERIALTQDTLYVHPDDPAFATVVATTRRYLASLVASEQRSSSSRTAADTTGAALALVSQPKPKPPTPVRTGALRQDAAPPGDDAPLDDHERAYYPKSKRA